MPTNLGQIIRIVRENEAKQTDGQTGENIFTQMRSGYYFLVPRKEKKQRKSHNTICAMTAFGPFESSHTARFIETSALALGLIQPDPVLASTPHRAELEARKPAPHKGAFGLERNTPPRALPPVARELMVMH